MLRCSPFPAVSLLQRLLARLRLTMPQPTQTPLQLLIALLAAAPLKVAVQLKVAVLRLKAAAPLKVAAPLKAAAPLQSAKLPKPYAQT